MKIYTTITLSAVREVAADLGFVLDRAEDDGVRVQGKNKGKRVLNVVLAMDYSKPLMDGYRTRRFQAARPSSHAMGAYKDGFHRLRTPCWHGYWHFFHNIFKLDPDATFITLIDRWDGLEDFLNRAEASGNINVGSKAEPLNMNERCECEATGDYILPTRAGAMA
jgi:hypothetical protein